MPVPPNPPDRRRITIRDVAALAEVDVSLVSRVLNDHPKASAGRATRERILDAARTLGCSYPTAILRVLVPGLQPLHADHRVPFLGGPLWRPRGLAEWAAIPPHPFP